MQSCEPEDADGSKMLCRMPAVNIPDDLIEELEEMEDPESETIDGTEGPGVASYISSDGSVRVDIFIGLKLDGVKRYKNISAAHPRIKMEFALEPILSCPDVIAFDPSKSTSITIQVDAVFVYIFLLLFCLCVCLCVCCAAFRSIMITVCNGAFVEIIKWFKFPLLLCHY